MMMMMMMMMITMKVIDLFSCPARPQDLNSAGYDDAFDIGM